MRILRITTENLASLAGRHTVDFTAEPLRSTGLFAIIGPTGSGKSTLLDAMCLALFHETPRLQQAPERQKSAATNFLKEIAAICSAAAPPPDSLKLPSSPSTAKPTRPAGAFAEPAEKSLVISSRSLPHCIATTSATTNRGKLSPPEKKPKSSPPSKNASDSTSNNSPALCCSPKTNSPPSSCASRRRPRHHPRSTHRYQPLHQHLQSCLSTLRRRTAKSRTA